MSSVKIRLWTIWHKIKLIPKEKDCSNDKPTNYWKEKKTFFLLLKLLGDLCRLCRYREHHVLEHHVLFSWSLTCGHSMRPLCDDHEEDGNDEFWIQVYQGGKSDLPSSHRVNLVPRPVILSKVLLTHPHRRFGSFWLLSSFKAIAQVSTPLLPFIISELRILMVPGWFTIRYHLKPIQGIWKQSAKAEWKNHSCSKKDVAFEKQLDYILANLCCISLWSLDWPKNWSLPIQDVDSI